jgi:hypothetical protein
MNPTLKHRHDPVRLMKDLLGTAQTAGRGSRRLACSGCGTEFSCDLSGACWCAAETARLPMPSNGGDCLCHDCLRKLAEQAAGAVAR